MRRTVHIWLLACLCVGAMFATPTPAGAFGLTGFGGKLGYVTPESLDGTMALGAHLEFGQHDSRLNFMPSLMYWKANDVSDVSANADLYYHFVREGVVTPYVGAGLGMNFLSNNGSNQSDSQLGANLFGGFQLPASARDFFFEGRYTASETSQFAVLGGVTFHGWSH